MSDTGFESARLSLAEIERRRKRSAQLRAKNLEGKPKPATLSKPKKQEPKAPEIIEIDPLSLQWL